MQCDLLLFKSSRKRFNKYDRIVRNFEFSKKNSNFEKNFEEKKITKFFAFLGFGLDFEVRIFCSIFYRV